jgi:hypothetical protein
VREEIVAGWAHPSKNEEPKGHDADQDKTRDESKPARENGTDCTADCDGLLVRVVA